MLSVSFSFRPVKLLSSAFCSSTTYYFLGALFIMSVYWVFILWNTEGLASICRPFQPPSTGAVDRGGRATKAQLSHCSSCVALKGVFGFG